MNKSKFPSLVWFSFTLSIKFSLHNNNGSAKTQSIVLIYMKDISELYCSVTISDNDFFSPPSSIGITFFVGSLNISCCNFILSSIVDIVLLYSVTLSVFPAFWAYSSSFLYRVISPFVSAIFAVMDFFFSANICERLFTILSLIFVLWFSNASSSFPIFSESKTIPASTIISFNLLLSIVVFSNTSAIFTMMVSSVVNFFNAAILLLNVVYHSIFFIFDQENHFFRFSVLSMNVSPFLIPSITISLRESVNISAILFHQSPLSISRTISIIILLIVETSHAISNSGIFLKRVTWSLCDFCAFNTSCFPAV